MKILVLGGTEFLGRHFVEAALLRGHQVTLFTRGQHTNPFAGRVVHLLGDRDAHLGKGLEALASGTWDTVIDTSGYLPEHVAASASLLRGRVHRYVYISSISVYADLSLPGIDEEAPVATLKRSGTNEQLSQYGALKALCEQAVIENFGKQSLILRPGQIIGPYESNARFAYWAARFGSPTLLGHRREAVVMPAPPNRPLQCIDARDLVLWILVCLAADRGGIFNVASAPGHWSMGDLAHAGHQLSVTRGFDLAVNWVDDATLIAQGVVPWTGLPMWVPLSETHLHGLQQVDVTRALDAGLVVRPLLQSLFDTLEWLIRSPDASRWKDVLTAPAEDALALAAAA